MVDLEETIMQELRAVGSTASAAARSGAYIYPFKGIVYFLAHRSLWKPLLSRLTPAMTLGTSVTALLFIFLYLPQTAILAFTSGPIAAITSAIMVLSESSTLTTILSRSLLIGDSLVDTFDGTLLARGQDALVARQRTVKSGGVGDAISRLGRLASRPFSKFAPTAIVRYLVFLPLNFIPVVGTGMFVLLQGKRVGPAAHARYFQLKGLGKTDSERLVEERRGAYTSFGVTATLLEMIPVVGIVFAFTNTCGAALWAADMEAKQAINPNLREQAKKAK